MNRLKIPQIHNYIHWLGNVGYRQFGCSFSYAPKTYALLDDFVTMVIEVDRDLLQQVKKVLKPYGLTPEQAIVDFLNFCVNPATREKAISRLLQWKNEQE